MLGRAKRRGNPSARAVADAVEMSTDITNAATTPAHGLLSNKQSGIRTVFSASLKAVAGSKSGMDAATFKAALRATVAAMDRSSIPDVYERMRISIESVPEGLVGMAARQAAGDAQTHMGLERRGKNLLARIDDAAIKAAEDRMLLNDGILAKEAAVKAARQLAEDAVVLTKKVVKTAVPLHAAAVAVFEVGIRGAGSHDLQPRIQETCDQMPELARPLGDLGMSMTVALANMLLQATDGRRLYRTAVKSAENACVEETLNRIVGMVDENTFEAVYGALAACAHTASGGRAFKSGYGKALTKACGVGVPQRLSPEAIQDILKDAPPEIASQIQESDLQDFFLQLQDKRDMLLGSADNAARRKHLGLARGVNYKKIAADPALAGMISMYKMAYDAGYEGAGAAAKGL